MQELLDTGLYKCIRQYSMEIHMVGPLAGLKHLERCQTLYKQMKKLNNGGWRLFNTTDNVRFRKHYNPKASQSDVKKEQLNGKAPVILWESSFVNFDVEGPCKPFV